MKHISDKIEYINNWSSMHLGQFTWMSEMKLCVKYLK